MAVTGKHDLRGFWKMSPAELAEWCEAANDEDDGEFDDVFSDLEEGEEVID